MRGTHAVVVGSGRRLVCRKMQGCVRMRTIEVAEASLDHEALVVHALLLLLIIIVIRVRLWRSAGKIAPCLLGYSALG